MPQPGMVPMIGEQLGQVTTFGTIVALRGGGIVVNTGDATTPIELPGGVEVLKPLKAAPADLKVGMPVTAAGSVTGDGVLVASSVRMTSEGPLAR